MGRITKKGVNDLATTHPNLLKYWDEKKDENISLSNYRAGSNKYVYWKCEKGHSFRTSIYNMTHSKHGNNCPICRNFIIVPSYNDLATTHPELVKQWDENKNIKRITEYGAGSNDKVWWKCDKGHSWQAAITSKVRGNGCPYCSNQKVLVGYNDLGTLYPRILRYWDYDKNTTSPSDYAGTKSNKTAWFKCEKGHSWKSIIGDFTRGNGCPICANKQIVPGYNDLATTHPDLVKEWDYDKNLPLLPTMVSFGTHTKAWWRCEKGHSWKAAIYSRASNNHGCPFCLREHQTSVTEKAFSFYLSKYFNDLRENVHFDALGKRELDIYIPSLQLAVEYDGHNWHKNSKQDLIKDNLCKENEITLIRIREEGCTKYESSAYFIDAPRNHGNLLLLKKPLNDLFSLINKLYSLSLPAITDIDKDVTNINERYYTYSKTNSLLNKNPELAKEWNYEKNGNLTPEMIAIKSNQKVWWKCDKGHEWMANVQSRDRGNGCPYCSGKYALKGFNDLKTLNPSLALEWDKEKNGELKPEDVTVGSDQKVWWKCDKGHSWKAYIAARNKGAGCPYCSGLLCIKGENDLETLFPDLSKEWDYDKNGELKPTDIGPGHEKKVWWLCPVGHSYQANVRSRARLKTGCPICKNKMVLPGYNDLATLQPELSKQWDFERNGDLKPTMVGGGGGSHKKIWWRCENGHQWQATLASRINLHTGCPVCAINKTKKRFS